MPLQCRALHLNIRACLKRWALPCSQDNWHGLRKRTSICHACQPPTWIGHVTIRQSLPSYVWLVDMLGTKCKLWSTRLMHQYCFPICPYRCIWDHLQSAAVCKKLRRMHVTTGSHVNLPQHHIETSRGKSLSVDDNSMPHHLIRLQIVLPSP